MRLGDADRLEKFVNACRSHFGQGRPCLGCLQDPVQANDEYLSSQAPVPRAISKKCLGVLGKDAGGEVTSCQECLRLRDSLVPGTGGAMRDSMVLGNGGASGTDLCKVEVKSDAEEGVDCDSEGEKRDDSDDDKLEVSRLPKNRNCEPKFLQRNRFIYLIKMANESEL